MVGFLGARVAKWWLPDDVIVVEEIPHTATGKIKKSVLRERFAGHLMPSAAAE
jgi:fatty-acyl-CoA synthase